MAEKKIYSELGHPVTAAQLESLFGACPIPLLVHDGSGVIFANAGARRLSGDWPAIEKLAADPRAPGRWVLLSRDGTPAGAETNSWNIALNTGAATVITFQACDRAGDSEVARLYDEAPIGLAALDANLRYRRINRLLAQWNGRPAEDHIGRTVDEVIPDLAPYFTPLLKGVIDSGEPLLGVELGGNGWQQPPVRHTIANFLPLECEEGRGVQVSVIEVSPLKQAAQKLSEQLAIFEQVHDAVIQTDLEGRVRAWNRGAEIIFGYSAAEAEGRHVSFLYFEEDRNRMAPEVVEPLRDRGWNEAVLRNRRKDGTECWIRLSLSLVRDAEGAPHGMVGYSEDITTRVRAERDLKASETRYRNLFHASPIGIGTWNPDGTLIEANSQLLGMLGGAPEAAVLRAELAPAALRAGQTGIFEDEWVRADGKKLPVLVGIAEPLANDARIVSYVADLTQLKQAEKEAQQGREFLELALRGANLGLWDWDLRKDEVKYHQCWPDAPGIPVDKLGANSSAWQDWVHPQDLASVWERWNAHARGETPFFEAEYRARSESGEWKWLLARGKVIERAPDGTAVRAAGTHLDISQRKLAESASARSERLFHAVFDQALHWKALLATDGRILELNRAALVYGNLTRESAIGQTCGEAFFPGAGIATQERIQERIRRAAAGEHQRFEVEVGEDGARERCTLDCYFRPVHNEQGEVELLVAEGRDITEIKRAQAAVHAESERQRLEAVLRSMAMGVVIAGPTGDVIYANPSAQELLSLPNQGAGVNLLSLDGIEPCTPSSRPVAEGESPMARLIRGEPEASCELKIRNGLRGEVRVANLHATAVRGQEGDFEHLVVTILDVTRQHETDSALRQSTRERDVALEAGGMRVWRCSHSEGALPASELAAALLGPGLRGADGGGLDAINTDDRAAFGRFCDGLALGRAEETEYRLGHSETAQWQASRGQALRDDHGRIVGWTGVSWDITPRKAAEAEIQAMNSSLRRLSRELLRSQDLERRRLARELHDGPVQMLTAAAMNLAIVAKTSGLQQNERALQLAEEGIAWVKQSIGDMRSLSYVLYPPNLDELGLTAALRAWIAGFRERTGIDLDARLEDVGRLSTDAETNLFRIVQEALSNIHRHSRSSTGAVCLSRVEGSIRLEITDAGCGIPAGLLGGNSPVGNLGVGLPGMRERATQLGGSLEITSEPGHGTRLVVTLPGDVPR